MLHLSEFRHLGRLIWRQSRDISVYNYPGHIIYEIYTNQGYMYVSEEKDSKKVDVVRTETFKNTNVSEYKSEKEFLPNLK